MFNSITAEEPPPEGLTPFENFKTWLFSDPTRILFTVVTFIVTISGLLLETLFNAEPTGHVFYAVAYVTGGIYGLQAGLQTLRERKIDVDLLMVLAAIGAFIVCVPPSGRTSRSGRWHRTPPASCRPRAI